MLSPDSFAQTRAPVLSRGEHVLYRSEHVLEVGEQVSAAAKTFNRAVPLIREQCLSRPVIDSLSTVYLGSLSWTYCCQVESKSSS